MTLTDPLEIWKIIAPHYVSIIDQAPHNALYERPAMRSLIGRPQGLNVLDIGCGSGYYLEYLLQSGAASVTGVDGNEYMIDACARRTNNAARLFTADLRQQLPFLQNNQFDLAVASLVLHYLEDWTGLLKELHRVIRPKGNLVISTGHPLSDFAESTSGNYFELELIREEWSSFGVTMPGYRRPFGSLINDFCDAGFRLTRVLEPVPLPEMADVKPKSFEKLNKKPGFICLRFEKVS
ncbi:class I SAM-dependent methyltransferase [Pseudomonas sp. EA_65y_Pfl2_P74]|uniref:class I SAM-dependent methyltransferase n=1 Tax=Pseudomonas sp. EA_65y_Pfl2_P74 TaxID=3088694 RepID=UPI0030DD0B98